MLPIERGLEIVLSTAKEKSRPDWMPAEGVKAVAMIENTKRMSPRAVGMLKTAGENEGLLRRGAEAREGDTILPAGRRISVVDLSLLAGTGKSVVMVSRRPRVAIIATG